MRSHCIAYKGYRKSNERKKKHRNSSLIMCAHAAATSYSASIIIIIHTYSVQRWWRSFAYILCWRYYILPYICIHSSRNPFVYYTRIYHYNGSPRGGWWRVRRPIVMCYIILLYNIVSASCRRGAATRKKTPRRNTFYTLTHDQRRSVGPPEL